MTSVVGNIDDFVANINRGLDEAQVDRNYLTEMDHVCYRVETYERYEELLREMAKSTRMVGQPSVINGRPIATFQFDYPIQTGGWSVNYLELPAPKEGSPYTEGLEHAEFVVLGGDLDLFRSRHPHLEKKFSASGMKKSINPELGLNAYGMSVKFHELALGKVVRIEQSVTPIDPIAGGHITI